MILLKEWRNIHNHEFIVRYPYHIWFANGDEKLSDKIKQQISGPENNIVCSLVSLFEIAIKTNLGKLDFNLSFDELEKLLTKNNIKIILPSIQDYNIYRNLPLHHKDPFDRLIISQSISNHFTVVTKDDAFLLYGIPVIM